MLESELKSHLSLLEQRTNSIPLFIRTFQSVLAMLIFLRLPFAFAECLNASSSTRLPLFNHSSSSYPQ